jgi:hypothetical protein
MPVYTPKRLQELQNALDSMAQRFLARLPLILTDQEFIAAFIHADHIQKLREVHELVGGVKQSGSVTTLWTSRGDKVVAYATFGKGVPPTLMPSYVGHGMAETCPDDIAQKITDWADQRIELGNAWSDAFACLDYLNSKCDSADTMARLLPCLPYVMSQIDDRQDARTTKAARRLNDSTRIGRVPAIPRDVKDRMHEVSGVVSSYALIKDNMLTEPPRSHCSLVSQPYQTRTLASPGGIFGGRSTCM